MRVSIEIVAELSNRSSSWSIVSFSNQIAHSLHLRDEVAAEGRKIIYTNIGNPHAVGQKPITYYRQVLALCDLPDEFGIGNPNVASAFPSDVIERALEMRAAIGPAGTGAYTNSQGISEFRDDVANFITARDGHVSSSSDIFLTNGASSAIEHVLTGLIGNNRDAVMIPIPQYVSTNINFDSFISQRATPVSSVSIP
jgi:alanine transaminase